MALTINEGTQTDVLSVLNGGTEIPYVKLDAGVGSAVQDWGGTIPTVANLTNGTVHISVGTIVGGTIQNLVSGTINALASGTLTGGTLQNLVSGTINALASGTITGGTLQNLTTGTINAIASGTITGGTLQNLVSGTVNALASGTITGGTVQNLVSGTVNALVSGTITGGTLQNLVSGTINSLVGGTLGNLTYGTVNIDPTPINITPLNWGTLGTAGGSFFATVSGASGAGTKHYITGLSVIGQAGTVDVRILAGSSIQGTGVLGAGNVVPGGGYIRDFKNPFPTGTNSELVYHFVGAGTAFIIVNYWKGA